MQTEKTLVIILSETRAHELTFDGFKKNVLDELNADLCICIGTKSDYDVSNPFYQQAKYRFLYNEPDDFGDAFEYAYNTLSECKPIYECLQNINFLYGQISKQQCSSDNITYYGGIENIPPWNECKDDEIVVHTKDFPDTLWKNQVYGVKNSIFGRDGIHQEHVHTYKKPLYWREFLKIQNQIFGGVKDSQYQHPGSAGILIFFRWFLYKNILENNLLEKYDRFIITRSDFIYQLPHPPIELLDPHFIWIPNGEHYGGYTDRHVVLSRTNLQVYLNILHCMVFRSNEYFMKMMHKSDWNLEQLIKFHLEQNGVGHLVKEIPYVMYAVRPVNGTTRWSSGHFSDSLGYYIKYLTEFEKSNYYKQEFEKSGLTLTDFYKNCVKLKS